MSKPALQAIVLKLLQKGVDPDLKNDDDDTAIEYARCSSSYLSDCIWKTWMVGAFRLGLSEKRVKR